MPNPENALRKSFVVEFSPLGKDFKEAAGQTARALSTDIPPVEIEAPVPSDDCAGYIAALPGLLAGARQAAAERLLDSSRFASGLALSEAARILSGRIDPCGISLANEGESHEFLVEADYARNEGPFADTFAGIDAEEAEFQARWQMTENAGHFAHEDPRAFASVMGRHRIRDVIPQPVPERRLRELLSDLVREAQAAGHSGPALDAALAAADELDLDVTPASSPKM